MGNDSTPPICDYEGSDYQTSFWGQGHREYEDRAEKIALSRLLPDRGRIMLELGAGAGRNTPLYQGFETIVLVDYSLSQLRQAQARLGDSRRYIYVAANIYHLPFKVSVFDAATMIRTLHHMADPERAIKQVARVLQKDAAFILEYANKRNIKAILRYWLRRQEWSPFTLEPIEFAALNYDFHPRAVESWLLDAGFTISRRLTVSHFRLTCLKRRLPLSLLVRGDSLLQWTGRWFQFSPSVFILTHAAYSGQPSQGSIFACPMCESSLLEEERDGFTCSGCRRKWLLKDGIYDFRVE